MDIILGGQYEDAITGYKGIAIGHADYITGCSMTLLVPRAENNKREDGEWFDDARLFAISSGVISLPVQSTATIGGDITAPKR